MPAGYAAMGDIPKLLPKIPVGLRSPAVLTQAQVEAMFAKRPCK